MTAKDVGCDLRCENSSWFSSLRIEAVIASWQEPQYLCFTNVGLNLPSINKCYYIAHYVVPHERRLFRYAGRAFRAGSNVLYLVLSLTLANLTADACNRPEHSDAFERESMKVKRVLLLRIWAPILTALVGLAEDARAYLFT